MIARHARRRGGAATWLISASMLVGLGCGDDTSAVNVDTEASSGSAGADDPMPLPPVTSADSTIGDSASGDTGSGSVDTTMGVVDDTTTTGVDPSGSESGSDTGETGTTGGDPLPGQSQGQLVSSGRTMSSTNFTMVYTLGQPTQTQATHSSTNYRLQGGLVGANGSPP